MGLGMSHVQRMIGSKRSRACPSRPRLATARAPPAGCPHKHPDHLHVVVEAEAYRTIRHVLRRLVLARLACHLIAPVSALGRSEAVNDIETPRS